MLADEGGAEAGFDSVEIEGTLGGVLVFAVEVCGDGAVFFKDYGDVLPDIFFADGRYEGVPVLSVPYLQAICC